MLPSRTNCSGTAIDQVKQMTKSSKNQVPKDATRKTKSIESYDSDDIVSDVGRKRSFEAKLFAFYEDNGQRHLQFEDIRIKGVQINLLKLYRLVEKYRCSARPCSSPNWLIIVAEFGLSHVPAAAHKLKLFFQRYLDGFFKLHKSLGTSFDLLTSVSQESVSTQDPSDPETKIEKRASAAHVISYAETVTEAGNRYCPRNPPSEWVPEPGTLKPKSQPKRRASKAMPKAKKFRSAEPKASRNTRKSKNASDPPKFNKKKRRASKNRRSSSSESRESPELKIARIGTASTEKVCAALETDIRRVEEDNPESKNPESKELAVDSKNERSSAKRVHSDYSAVERPETDFAPGLPPPKRQSTNQTPEKLDDDPAASFIVPGSDLDPSDRENVQLKATTTELRKIDVGTQTDESVFNSKDDAKSPLADVPSNHILVTKLILELVQRLISEVVQWIRDLGIEVDNTGDEGNIETSPDAVPRHEQDVQNEPGVDPSAEPSDREYIIVSDREIDDDEPESGANRELPSDSENNAPRDEDKTPDDRPTMSAVHRTHMSALTNVINATSHPSIARPRALSSFSGPAFRSVFRRVSPAEPRQINDRMPSNFPPELVNITTNQRINSLADLARVPSSTHGPARGIARIMSDQRTDPVLNTTQPNPPPPPRHHNRVLVYPTYCIAPLRPQLSLNQLVRLASAARPRPIIGAAATNRFQSPNDPTAAQQHSPDELNHNFPPRIFRHDIYGRRIVPDNVPDALIACATAIAPTGPGAATLEHFRLHRLRHSPSSGRSHVQIIRDALMEFTNPDVDLRQPAVLSVWLRLFDFLLTAYSTLPLENNNNASQQTTANNNRAFANNNRQQQESDAGNNNNQTTNAHENQSNSTGSLTRRNSI